MDTTTDKSTFEKVRSMAKMKLRNPTDVPFRFDALLDEKIIDGAARSIASMVTINNAQWRKSGSARRMFSEVERHNIKSAAEIFSAREGYPGGMLCGVLSEHRAGQWRDTVMNVARDSVLYVKDIERSQNEAK